MCVAASFVACVCVRKREKGCVIVNQKVGVHGVVRCCCGGANKKAVQEAAL